MKSKHHNINFKAILNKTVKLFANMSGMRPKDVMSDEEINAHLTNAFDKFDDSGDGQLGVQEYTQAWLFFGLKEDEDGINDIFKFVDTNNSGLIGVNEFITAIKGERL